MMMRRFWAAPLVMVTVMSAVAFGQLQITEIMFDSDSDEPEWEWVEVRNPGAMPFELNGGYYFDDDGDDLAAPNLDIATTPNTMIPANGVAVIFNGAALDETRFRAAWNLPSGTPLIGANFAPQLRNGGDHFGIWRDTTSYQADLGDSDMDGDLEIVQFDHALANVDYTGFAGGSGTSSYWNGTGSYQDVANWNSSDNDMNAFPSVMTTITAQLNSTEDVGNPGVVTTTGAGPSALLITEIMSNPRSAEPDWEWVEVFNNTASAIDFSTTPYYFDDDDDADLDMPNIDSGVIGPGNSAILFNDDITAQNFEDAWGAGNHIPVDFGGGLANAGDTIGLWVDESAYLADRAAGGIPTGAVSYVPLGDESWTFGTGDGFGSLTLVNLTDPTADLNWNVSIDGDNVSFFASAVVGTTTDHLGDDIGSPGLFTAMVALAGDYDDSGAVGAGDLGLVLGTWGSDMIPPEWVNQIPAGNVGAAELGVVLAEWGNTAAPPPSVPEPAGLGIMSLAALAGFVRRRRR